MPLPTRRALLLSCLLGLLLTVAQAQAPTPAQLKDGVFRRAGTMFELRAGHASPLTAPLTLPSGTVVQPDGLVVQPDGTRQTLPDGRAVTMQGQVVGLADDMLRGEAIVARDQRVTGAQPTRLTVAAPAPLPPDLVAALRRTEQRLALLQQLTSRLADRTAAVAPAAPPLDARLRALDAQLRQP